MMNVGIKAEVLTLKAVAVMQNSIVLTTISNKVNSLIDNLFFIPTNVISIAGHSISAINPQFLRGETVAVYA